MTHYLWIALCLSFVWCSSCESQNMNNQNTTEQSMARNGATTLLLMQVIQQNIRAIVLNNLAYSVACYQGKSLDLAFALQNYARYGLYGCWCIIGGTGKPVDSIDRCCKVHDECFGAAAKRHNKNILTNTLMYNAKYTVVCEKRKTICSGSSQFGLEACQCDRSFSSCLNKHKSKWNLSHILASGRRKC